MQKVIEAVYEDGVLKPLQRIDLKEHEKVSITLKSRESAVDRTKGMFRAQPELIKFIAEDESILWEE